MPLRILGGTTVGPRLETTALASQLSASLAIRAPTISSTVTASIV